MVKFDISSQVHQVAPRRKVNEQPQITSALLKEPLILKNTFNVPIKIKGIFNNNPEIRLTNPSKDSE